VLNHPRYRLHVVTSRGRHILGREGRARTPVGYLGAFATNSLHRKSLGAWLERCVFSTPGAALPFGTQDFRTRQHALSEANFNLVLQASCSIPFLLAAVHDIPGAPRGAYWDGGITDYHLHLDYQAAHDGADEGIVLYPHFQQAVVPGWLDKGLRWRHKSTGFLDRMVVLAPDPNGCVAAQRQAARPQGLHPFRQRCAGAHHGKGQRPRARRSGCRTSSKCVAAELPNGVQAGTAAAWKTA
jgi:hypothetical protein